MYSQKEYRLKSVTYTQIAEKLAARFDLIYYVSCRSSHYVELSAKRKSGELKVQEEGDDFFASAERNLDRLIFLEDRERIRTFLKRERLFSELDERRRELLLSALEGCQGFITCTHLGELGAVQDQALQVYRAGGGRLIEV